MHLFWVDMHPDEISYTDGQCHSVVCTIGTVGPSRVHVNDEKPLQVALNFRLAEHGSVVKLCPAQCVSCIPCITVALLCPLPADECTV